MEFFTFLTLLKLLLMKALDIKFNNPELNSGLRLELL